MRRSFRNHLLGSAWRLGAVPLGATLLLASAGGPARANPSGGHVVAGQATITAPNPSTVDVVQSSQRASINWNSFSVAPGEVTQFQQPNAQAVTLNRVTGSDLSTIAGQLRANGQVILINQSGIVFSKGSEVDTGGLIATTTDVSDARFMAGQTAFTNPSTRPGARVVNAGLITVRQAGLAALVAPSVANSGVINATLGRVVLAGAQTFTADLYGDGLVSFDITSRVSQAPGGGALVSNTGQITADGGHILLTADAVDGIIGELVDAGGSLRARAVGTRAGTIEIAGNGAGIVAVSGALDASGAAPGQRGGTISVLGPKVGLLDGASLDASGQAGGGLVMVGGNFHGAGPQQQAQITYVAPTARLTVDATAQGNGGAVAIWSDGQTAFYGDVSARGGAGGGDGGYVEVSGHDLAFAGIVDRSAPRGRAGSLLLDPAIVNIDDDANAPNNDDKLPTILTGQDPNATYHILASAIDEALQSGDVSIAAGQSINVNAEIFGLGEQSRPTSLDLTAPSISIAADIYVSGNLGLNGAVKLASPSGTVTLFAENDFGAGQISGANTLTIEALSATLNGADVSALEIDSQNILLQGGTYTIDGPVLSFGTVSTVGSLVLGTAETIFGETALAGDTTLDASAKGGTVSVERAESTEGAANLSLTTAGSGVIFLEQVGDSGTLGALTVNGPLILGGPDNGSSVVDASSVDFKGPVTTGLGASTITANSVTFEQQVIGANEGGTLTGQLVISNADTVVLHGVEEGFFSYPGGSTAFLGSGSYDVGSVEDDQHFNAITTSGTLLFGNPTSFGPVTLAGDTTFGTDRGSVALTFSSIDSDSGADRHSATFVDTGISALTLGAVGSIAPLGTLTVDGPTNTYLDGNVSASSVDIVSPVILENSVTVDAPGGATFGEVDSDASSASLAFTADTGNVTLGRVDLRVEEGDAGSLAVASATSTVFLNGDVDASSILLPGPVSIRAGITTSLDTTGGEAGGPITLGPVSGQGTLFLASEAAISLSGLDVAELDLGAVGTLDLHAGTYTAGSGSLDFGDATTDGSLVLGSPNTHFGAITLAANTTLDATASNGSVQIFSVAAATPLGQGLTVATSSSGTINLVEGTGGSTLSFLSLNGPVLLGSLGDEGGPVSIAAGTISIPDALQTAQDTTLSTGGGAILLGPASGIGTTTLVLAAGTGSVTLNGVVEAGLDLAGSTGPVRLDAGTYTIGGGQPFAFPNVTTSGDLYFGQTTSFGDVTMAADTSFSSVGQGVSLSLGALDGLVGAGPLTARFDDLTVTGLSLGVVGGVAAPALLDVDIGGVTTLHGDVSATGLRFASAVELAGSVDVSAPSGASFNTVDAAPGAVGTLALGAGTGTVFLGPVGQSRPLAALIADATVPLVLDGDVTAGSIDLPGPVSLPASAAITTTDGNLVLGPVTGPQATLTLASAGGSVVLSGFDIAGFAIGGGDPVLLQTGLYQVPGTLRFGDVSTSGTLLLPQATQFGQVLLASDTTLDMTASSPLSLGQASGTATLTVIGGDATFAGLTTKGFVAELTGTETLTTGTYGLGGGSFAFGNAVGFGTLTLEQATSFASLRLGSDLTLDSAAVGGALTLGPVSGGAYDLVLDAGVGAVSLSGVQAGDLIVGSAGRLTLNGGSYDLASGTLSLGDVTVNGAIGFGQATTLGFLSVASDSALATTGDAPLSIAGAAGGPYALGLNAGGGVLTVAGPVDGVGSLVLVGGAVQLGGAIGSITPVGSVSIASLAALTVSESVTANGDLGLTASGEGSGVAIDAPVRSLSGGVSLGASGDITLLSAVGAPVGTVILAAGGAVSEVGDGSLDAAVLTGAASGGSAILDSADNAVGALGGFGARGDLVLRDAVSLDVLGSSSPVTAGGELTLIDAASLTVQSGASVSGAHDTALGAFGGTLGIAGAVVASTGGVYLAGADGLDAGALASLRAGGTVAADAGGTVDLAAGGRVVAGGDVLFGYGASQSAAFAQYGLTAPSGIAGALTQDATVSAGRDVALRSGGVLTVGAALTAGLAPSGGSVSLSTTGGAADIALAGTVSATSGSAAGSGTVSLDATGNVDEGTVAPGAIDATALSGQSGGWAVLGGQNHVGTLTGFGAGGQIAATSDASHVAGTSFSFVDASALAIAGGTGDTAIAGPGSIAIAAPGQAVSVAGTVSITSGSFVELAASTIDQTGALSLSAPLAALDVTGLSPAALANLFGPGGSGAQSAFSSGRLRVFLGAYGALIKSGGASDASSGMQLADVEAPDSTVLLATNAAPIVGTVDVGGLAVVSGGGGALLAGSVAGASGPTAAASGFTFFGPNGMSTSPSVTLDGCELGAVACGALPPPPPPPAPEEEAAFLLNLPVQPQLVTDVTDATGTFLPGLDPQQSQTVARAIELLPFDEIQQERTLDDIGVDRLDTGREDDD